MGKKRNILHINTYVQLVKISSFALFMIPRYTYISANDVWPSNGYLLLFFSELVMQRNLLMSALEQGFYK